MLFGIIVKNKKIITKKKTVKVTHYRYAMYKGVDKNQNYTWLICAAQNMKDIAIKNNNVGKKH